MSCFLCRKNFDFFVSVPDMEGLGLYLQLSLLLIFLFVCLRFFISSYVSFSNNINFRYLSGLEMTHFILVQFTETRGRGMAPPHFKNGRYCIPCILTLTVLFISVLKTLTDVQRTSSSVKHTADTQKTNSHSFSDIFFTSSLLLCF